MKATSVRVAGIQTPAYLNGRSRQMLEAAFRPAVTTPDEPTYFVRALNAVGMRPGEGAPFAAMYMARSRQKVHGLQAA